MNDFDSDSKRDPNVSKAVAADFTRVVDGMTTHIDITRKGTIGATWEGAR